RASGTEEVDLEAMIKHGERAGEITLLPGDVLVIPQAKAEEVLIAGAVERPGPVNIRGVENRDILRLLTLAGLTTAADKTRICVFRGEQQIVINYKQLLEEGQLEKNIQLEPGDLVYVPSLDRVYVLGAVSSGGRAIPCPKEGIKLLDALVEAGGMSPTANPDDIHVVRPRPDGVTEHVEIQLGQVKKGKAPPALVLKPGDIVYVGSLKGPRFTWYSIREMLWSLGALRALF
ncbi:MAG: hypothetical protein H5T86_08960, partial [Armatimonadetes bacterium]|nr:hypothetical protein [Armatimonadota bacterium]